MADDDGAVRTEIRQRLGELYTTLRTFTGLHPDEVLTERVLRTCDALAVFVAPGPALKEARADVELRCRQLALATDRFGPRDPREIAAARLKAVAAVERYHDVLLTQRSEQGAQPAPGCFLRRRAE
jgi:phage gp37-like protein